MSIFRKTLNLIPFLLRRHFEKIGYIKPTLVATVTYAVECLDDEGDDFFETITFFLLEHSSGDRFFDYNAYGQCEELDRHCEYLKEIMVWMYGGPLPKGSEKIGETQILRIERSDCEAE